MTSNVIKKVICFILVMLSLTTLSFTEELRSNFKPFDPSNYPPEHFQINKRTFHHGLVDVQIIQISVQKYVTQLPSDICCRVWLNVFYKGKQNYQYYQNDIDAVGSYHGIRVPEYQPLAHYLIVVKVGGYDGELLLISDKGQVSSTLGGTFFVTPDGQYLISIYFSDVTGYSVIDANTGKEVYEKLFDTADLYLGDFYSYNGKLYYLVGTWDWDYDDKWITKRIEQLDLVKKKAVATDLTESTLLKGKKIQICRKHLDTIQDCSCKKVPPRPVFNWKGPEN